MWNKGLWIEQCDTCGKIVSESGPGVSWSDSWEYTMDGTPDFNPRAYRCSPCTDVNGIRPSNCNPDAGTWTGRNPSPDTGMADNGEVL